MNLLRHLKLTRFRPWLLTAPIAITGCGDAGVEDLAPVTLTIEVGQMLTADEVRQLQDQVSRIDAAPAPTAGYAPAYLAPYQEPAPLASTGGLTPGADYSEPTELEISAPTVNAVPRIETQPTVDSNDNWADAWVDWSEETPEGDNDAAASVTPVAAAPPVPEPLQIPPAGSKELFPLPLLMPAKPAVKQVSTATRVTLNDSPLPEGLLTEVPAASEIGRLMVKPIREGFALGRAGAVYSARGKFEYALREIATAKDAEINDDSHTQALNDGLLALEEAQHFLPQGDAPIAGLDVETIARGHKTPVLKEQIVRSERMLPQQAAARYHVYAAQRLAAAVGQEQAGSMALYGLGKACARQAQLADEPLARRQSLAFYRAAILAHNGNHLAANELGVGLANAGHYQAASQALEYAVARGGGSTVHRNLALVLRRLDQPHLAKSAERRAEQIAARERRSGEFSQRLGIQWLAPNDFSRAAGDSPARDAASTAVAQAPRPAPAATAAKPLGFLRTAFGRHKHGGVPQPVPSQSILGNRSAPPAPSQTIVR